MKVATLGLALSLGLRVAGWAQAQTIDDSLPAVTGYVTFVDTHGAFDVNARHIVVEPGASLTRKSHDSSTVLSTLEGLYPGERIAVWGKTNRKTGTIAATRVELRESLPTTVTGTALIDQIPLRSGVTKPGEMVVRADGYLLRVTGATQTHWTAPLTSLKDLTTNVWVDYHGTQQMDGTVLVDSLTARANTVSHGEDKMREKREFDPAQVDEGDKQGFWSKNIKGVDPRRLPAHRDVAMQARVERIGNSLVPAYQKALPVDDPTRIDFRFQVIEPEKWHDAVSLASGIILIPYPLVDRLENDSQLAAVLADNIAEVMEKQEVRAVPAKQAMTTSDLIGGVGGIFVPGLGLATGLATGGAARHMLTVAERQSGRVSLWLLHDAGFDLAQAPRAWWLLEAKKNKRLDETSLPARAANLYADLGTTWRTGF